MLDYRSAVAGHRSERIDPELALALLRRYEPVLHFTRGEQFFPCDVEPYVAQASLWYQRRGEDPVCALDRGELTLETLGQVDMGRSDAVYFLRFAEPLDPATLKAYQHELRRRQRNPEHRFVAGTGRLARVGYASRFVDALFNVTLLARGRVPGDTAAAAALTYERLTAGHGATYRYHGRVVRSAGWVVVQYWFFYVYNNWRSGFSGANDHEGDWEMITVYLAEREANGAIYATDEWTEQALDELFQPEWVAYAAHDYSGDDLRRRWDDPELEKIDGHPVVYVAAGSHASYFRRGEYLTELELGFLQPLVKITDWIQAFWVNQLRQYQGEAEQDEETEQTSNLFRIPFVDYARGDGVRLGPGQELTWGPPRLLNPEEGWLSSYRGLWGLYARDPFAGENAPAGPMYNRDRSMRRAWYDPTGWAGLDKVAPPDEEVRLLVAKQVELRGRQVELQSEIQHKAFELRNLGMAVRAMRTQPHLGKLYADYQRRIETLSAEVGKLREQQAADQALLHSLDSYLQLLRAGLREPPRVHIRRAFTPTADEQFRAGRLAEVWAAASIGLMLVVLVLLGYFARQYMIYGLSIMIALFAFVEATFRGRVVRMVTSVTIGLAVVAALVILYEFFWSIVALGVFLTGSYLLWENLRELWT